jgi:hypothetical protein
VSSELLVRGTLTQTNYQDGFVTTIRGRDELTGRTFTIRITDGEDAPPLNPPDLTGVVLHVAEPNPPRVEVTREWEL